MAVGGLTGKYIHGTGSFVMHALHTRLPLEFSISLSHMMEWEEEEEG